VAQGAAASQYDAASEEHEVSGWAVGFVLFAGLMMIMSGGFQIFSGLVALFENEFYVATRNYMFQFDATAWGWIHLILGIALAVSGYFLFVGRVWAGVVALSLAVLSAVANFFFIPYYPFWSLLMIALDVWVIWALTRPGAYRLST
jgi:hypothetical protein